MKRLLFTFLSIVAVSLQAFAVEGMWLPIFLKQLNEAEMKSMGMRISAEDIYSINKASLKDAVFLFGGGCTSEMISSQGLLLTNHHCGYGQIQMHSSLAHNYLKDGFWAKNKSEELPNEGLTATRIVRIEDVTEAVTAGAILSNGAFDQEVVERNIARIKKEVIAGTHYGAQIKPFYYGSEYYLFVTETFTDIRLVGAPPSYVGKFGGDTDNWMWPRHTGDYSLFRVYAGPDNKPAAYSPNNKPYQPLHFFPISMKGVREGDFTMIYGFPGRTQQYLPSSAVAFTMETLNPARIQMRQASLSVIDKAMLSSEILKIQYATKQSRISNAYKKWIGEQRGLKKLDAVAVKQLMEKQLPNLKEGSSWAFVFANMYNQYSEVLLATELYNELFFVGPELLRAGNSYNALVQEIDSLVINKEWTERQTKQIASIAAFFKNYNREVDKGIMKKVFPVFFSLIPQQYLPPSFVNAWKEHKQNADAWTESLYAKTQLSTAPQLEKLIQASPKKVKKMLETDPAVRLAQDFMDTYRQRILPQYRVYNELFASAMYHFMKAQRATFTQKRFYPDANSTLRISYGKVEGYVPADGIWYEAQTTTDGVMQKYIPGDSEFDLGGDFVQLVKSKDFTPYSTGTSVPVAFIASNHTTGGNSGSPVLNADGHLIGINFDRTWESTMSDVMYDPERCRNITVDIRYVLWTAHKLGGAEHLINELKLVY